MLFLHRWNRPARLWRPVRNLALLSFAGGVLAACGGGNFGAGKDASSQYRACLKKMPALYRYSGSFEGYLRKAKQVGRRCGIRSSTLHAGLGRLGERDFRSPDIADTGGLTLKEQIADATGADGVLIARRRGGNAVRDYLNNRVTPDLIYRGRRMMSRNRSLLRQIEKRYRVPGHYLVALWGIESKYGRVTGRYRVVPTLARLGYRSHRRRFFSSELLGALMIADRGFARLSRMYGSPAGAMGQTQFMPSAYIFYAVDHNGDGRRDIWRNRADVLASMANYNIKRGGWDTRTGSAIYEVRLPRRLRVDRTGFYNQRPLDYWRRAGVRRVDGRSLPRSRKNASVYMPAGCRGPVFLLTRNFRAIMRYNNLIEYAFAVSVLAEKIKHGFTIRKPWPRYDYALTKWERADLQRRLTRMGYGRLRADGILGQKSRRAIQRYQARKGLCASGHANTRLYDHVRRRRSGGNHADGGGALPAPGPVIQQAEAQ